MLLHDDKVDINKPVLDIFLERGNHRHPVFSMSQYGLHFKDQIGKWVQIRYIISVLLIICVECFNWHVSEFLYDNVCNVLQVHIESEGIINERQER